MKFLQTIVAVLLLQFCQTPFGHSQMQIGLKTNFSSSNIFQVSKDYYNSSEHIFNTLEYASSNNAIAYGITAYNELEYVFVTADVMYRKQTVDYILRTVSNDLDQTENYRENTSFIHLPIAAGILYKKFKLGVGPVINVPVERNNAFESIDNIDYRKRKVETGFQFMVGVKITDHFHIDMKRELSFTSISDNYYFNGEPASVRISPNKFSLSLSYIFN